MSAQADMSEKLKLRAEDGEDLQVIATGLQDALLEVADMAYLQAERRFALVVSRFCWERSAGNNQRTHCALAFDTVRSVRLQGIDRHQSERVLELLTIEAKSGAAGEPVQIDLVFAGQAAIRLEVDRVLCHLEDVGDPWPTPWQPAHSA